MTTSENETIRITSDTEVDALCRKYGAMIIRRCSQLLGNDDDGADAAQEVFIKVLTDSNLRNIKVHGKYLWVAATNHCLNKLRGKSPWGGNRDSGVLLETIASLESGEALEDRLTYRSILRRLFRRHPEITRVIAVLHFVDGLTFEETAKMVGMSKSGVQKHLNRLRETLRGMGGLIYE